MQSYRTEMSTGPAGTASIRGSDELANGSTSKGFYGDNSNTRSRDGDLAKYKDKYEQSMNPFEAFRGRVSPSGHSRGRVISVPPFTILVL